MRSKKAIFNILTNVILHLLIILYGFIVPKIIINSFGSNVNGLVSSITQFLAYISLLESGLGPVVKAALYKPIAKKNNETIANILKTSEIFFRKIAYIFLVYIIGLCFLYPLLINNDFGFIYTALLIIIIGISTFAEYFFGMTYKLFLQADQKNYIISIIQIISYVITIIVIVLLTFMNSNVHFIKLISGLIFVIRPLLLNYYVKKKYNINYKKSTENFELKQKWDGLAQHIAYVIHTNTDITILSIFSNLAEVSVYSVYYLVVKGIKSIIQAFTNGIDATFGDMIAKKENDNLNRKFNDYEVLFYTIITITYTCAIILIVPFIKVYTKGITDANYIRYAFGTLIVISEYIWAIRQPYNFIIQAAGHFKETRVGAWIECISNILVSLLLVNRYGLIGVAIGTIFAMSIRTIEFIYHTNKYILNRSIFESIKKILLIVIETLITILICNYLPFDIDINYISWIKNAIMVFLITCVITILLNYICFRKEYNDVITILKKVIKRNKK